MDVLKKVPHRHFVFGIPKLLRRYFLYDRKLLADLSRSAWESLKIFIQNVVPENNPIPGAVIAIQIFGDFLGFNPHCHILVTEGCFYGDGGMFRVASSLELKKLEAIFRHKALRMLLSKGKITQELIAMLSTWRHSPRSGCSTWIRKGRSFIHRRTTKRRRYSPPWNGWPPCAPTSPTRASRWCIITDTTAMSHGKKAEKRQ